jgi:hypothetical protein
MPSPHCRVRGGRRKAIIVSPGWSIRKISENQGRGRPTAAGVTESVPGRRRLRWFVTALAPPACYLLVVRLGMPEGLDSTPDPALLRVLAAFAVLLAFALSRRDWIPRAAARTLILILFALPLSALWKSGRSDGSKIGGLLPFSDADHYYHCASILAEGQGFSASPEGAFCSRRPLFASALGGLLAATGHDLRAALALLVLINAVACSLATWELRATHGPVAATLFVVTLFLFYRPLAGATLTEQLGLPLGAVGFAALWRSGRRDEPRMAIFGLFLLAFALISRAGAFLALPSILVWCALGGAPPARRSLRRFCLGGGVVVLAILLNAALVRTIGVPGSSCWRHAW